MTEFHSLEICAGAGGQALGLESVGFAHVALAELDSAACQTLRANRPNWNVLECDVRSLNGKDFKGIDLLAGGVPCPPFSIAGKQLGSKDERDLFPTALRLIEESKPRAVLLENVPGLASSRFEPYRRALATKLTKLGYKLDWQVLNACNYGVPQLRPRFILVAIRERYAECFEWPQAIGTPPTVGEALVDLMSANGWRGASKWAAKAKGIGPTLVGGSKLHGGPDLGPTRAKKAWLELGIDGKGISNTPPTRKDVVGHTPKLTLRMAARIQGFPDSWQFMGGKTAAYRQIGNAFPAPVAAAVAGEIAQALAGTSTSRKSPTQLSMVLRQA